jgi:glycosyltransferase involved in cell wall biosynthesis
MKQGVSCMLAFSLANPTELPEFAGDVGAVDLSIVMPVYNEERNLPEVLEEAWTTLAGAPFRFEVVLVDDASTDGSFAFLESYQQQHPQFPMQILRHEENRGIAAACNTLFAAARGNYVFLNASDGQCTTAECLRMMDVRDRYDLVVGKRRSKQYTWRRALISKAFNLLPVLLFGTRTFDAGSIKLVKAELLRLPLISRGPFREAERIIRAKRRGYRIGAVTVESHPRRGGKATGARWSLVSQAIVDLLHCWWRIVICRDC